MNARNLFVACAILGLSGLSVSGCSKLFGTSDNENQADASTATTDAALTDASLTPKCSTQEFRFMSLPVLANVPNSIYPRHMLPLADLAMTIDGPGNTPTTYVGVTSQDPFEWEYAFTASDEATYTATFSGTDLGTTYTMTCEFLPVAQTQQ